MNGSGLISDRPAIKPSPVPLPELPASIQEAFSLAARRNPDATALRGRATAVSYGELDRRSDAVAHRLIAAGVVPGARVGLYAQRSVETLVALLGILKSGCAYVPFDPGYPGPLLRHLVEDASPTVVLTQSGLAHRPGTDLLSGIPTLDLSEISESPGDASGDGARLMLPTVGPDDAAYVMYTSGSTGRPKGVVIPHRGVLRLVLNSTYAHFGPNETFLQLAPLSFDASTFEIWGALLNGGTVAVVESEHPTLDEIAQAVEHFGVSTLWLTAGLFHLMVDHRLESLRSLKQLLAGGDVLSPAHVRKALAGLPGCRLINGYGPTENTTFTCCYSIPPDHPLDAPVPIGTPIEYTEVHILDDAGKPVAMGEEGELFAGGLGVALGYLNRPDLDRERFIADPFGPRAGDLLYRTGDRVRQRPDGNIEFLGRADRQIKINGKRVELDEIEHCLRRSGLVGEAAVVLQINGAQKLLAAFVTPVREDSAPAALEGSLRRFLQGELPEYMQPATLHVRASLPLTPTGKIDRTRLREELSEPMPSASRAAPRNSTETTLLQFWQRVLQSQEIGIDDNFFQAGGTSLQLLEVHELIRAKLRAEVTAADLLKHPDIRSLAAWIDSTSPRSAERAGLLPLQPIDRIDRPVTMPEYYHASVAASRYTLERPREVIVVLRGKGSVSAQQWQAALDAVTAVNPGARLRRAGRLGKSRWVSDGEPPRLRLLDHCDWDGRSERDTDFLTSTRLSLDRGPSVELIVARQPDDHSLVAVRALHAVFDGAGAMHFLLELFRALRGDPLLGTNAAFSDVDLMLSLNTARRSESRDKTCWLTGEPRGRDRGDEFRLLPLGNKAHYLVAKLAIAMAAFARRRSERPVYIAVPVDLRRHRPGLLSTGNFASMLHVRVEQGDGPVQFQARLNAMLAQRLETAYPPWLERFKWLPLSWLDLLLSRTPWNYHRRKPLETAVISHVGNYKSQDLSCAGFSAQQLMVLPLQGTVFTTIAGLDGNYQMMINLPRVLSSEGRFDELMSELRGRLD